MLFSLGKSRRELEDFGNEEVHYPSVVPRSPHWLRRY